MYAKLVRGKLIMFNDTKKIYIVLFVDRISHTTVYVEFMCCNLTTKRVVLDANNPYTACFRDLN